MPLITVITVVYNAVKVIERTIQSVISQTSTEVEYVIVDGGSTDGTVDVINKYKSSISKWISEPDAGIYDAMNKGISLSSGSWLYFLNAGDYFIDKDRIKTIEGDLSAMGSNLHVYKVNVIDNNDNVVGQLPLKSHFSSFRDLFYSRFCHQAIFAQRKDYLDVGKFDTNFPTYGDFYTIGKIIKSGVSVVYHENVIANFDNNGVSSNWKKVIPLSHEREIILSLLDKKSTELTFMLAGIKSRLFYMRKMLKG